MAESRGFWFLLGLSVGAVAGVLYAPQAGDQTRELLSRKADEGRDLVTRKASDWRNQASSLREQASGRWREQTGSWKSQAGSVRDQASQYADRGKQVISRQIDQFQAAVEAGKQAYRESAGLNRSPEVADVSTDRPDGADPAARL